MFSDNHHSSVLVLEEKLPVLHLQHRQRDRGRTDVRASEILQKNVDQNSIRVQVHQDVRELAGHSRRHHRHSVSGVYVSGGCRGQQRQNRR